MQVVLFVFESIISGLFLWLGLYIFTRDLPFRKRTSVYLQRPALMAGVSTMLFGWFAFGVAMQTISHTASEYNLWQRLTWWAVPVGCGFYFSSMWNLVFQTHKRQVSQFKYIVPILGIFVGGAVASGTVADFFMNYEATKPSNSIFETYQASFRYPHYYVYALFVISTLLASSILLLYRFFLVVYRDQPEQRQWKWLVLGNVVILIGAIFAIVGYGFNGDVVPEQLGDFIIAIGAAIMGYGIANYNALDNEIQIKQDFWYSLLRVLIIGLVYNVFFWVLVWGTGNAQDLIVIPVLIYLAVLSHTPVDWGFGLSEQLLLPRWLIGYRNQLSKLRQEILFSKEPIVALDEAKQNFEQLVRNAKRDELEEMIVHEVENIFQYSRYWDDNLMEECRLQNLELIRSMEQKEKRKNSLGISNDTGNFIAERLRALLVQCIEEQLPVPDDENLVLSSDQIAYLILQKKYIENQTRAEVERFIRQTHKTEVSGGTYTRSLRQARKRLAKRLYEKEVQLIL